MAWVIRKPEKVYALDSDHWTKHFASAWKFPSFKAANKVRLKHKMEDAEAVYVIA